MKEKAIWKYSSPTGMLEMKIYDRGNGILANYPEGNISAEDARELLNFLLEYKKQYQKDIFLVIDNSRIKSVSTQARTFVANQFKDNTPLAKAASFGSNVMMRNFMNIFSGIMARSGIHHHSFKTEGEAISWLKQ